MSDELLNAARDFLITTLRGKEAHYETIHPWRKNWIFVVFHSYRVEKYVADILEGEPPTLSEKELLALRLAAILHDIGRIDGVQGHGVRSADTVRTWIIGQNQIIGEYLDLDKLYYLIETHSDKTSRSNDFSSGVLKDADLLDEIGAMSIFMAQNRPGIDRMSPYFFHQLEEQLRMQEVPFCEKQMDLLNTQTAKHILNEKINFINRFTAQLRSEMQGTDITFQPLNANDPEK
jgi:uncharacterized protein